MVGGLYIRALRGFILAVREKCVRVENENDEVKFFKNAIKRGNKERTDTRSDE